MIEVKTTKKYKIEVDENDNNDQLQFFISTKNALIIGKIEHILESHKIIHNVITITINEEKKIYE